VRDGRADRSASSRLIHDRATARSPSSRRPPAATPLQRCASARAAIPAWTINDEHLSLATRTCSARSDWTLSALSRPPCTLGNNALAPCRDGSLSHAWRAIRTCVVSGVHRSFRPLPTHRTWAPAPRWTESLSRLISSERRKPVWAASSSKMWLRRPSHVVRLGNRKDCFNLGARQEMHLPLVVPLAGYRVEHPPSHRSAWCRGSRVAYIFRHNIAMSRADLALAAALAEPPAQERPRWVTLERVEFNPNRRGIPKSVEI
jgi:hypothetical protein